MSARTGIVATVGEADPNLSRQGEAGRRPGEVKDGARRYAMFTLKPEPL